MLTVEEALARVLAHIPALGAEDVPLLQAYGRTAAGEVRSPVDVPPWDNSAFDGYAVQVADTREGAYTLRLNEVVGAGEVPTVAVTAGTATAVMTGAPMPEGADGVVPVEQSDGARQGSVALTGVAKLGAHVRPRGDDIEEGQVVLAAGEVLTPGKVGLVASLGLPTVSCVRRPRVAVLSTGDEVVRPGEPLAPGQIYSSNTYTMAGLVQAEGAEWVDLGIVGDDPEALRAALERGLDADVLVTTGGVSMGFFDHVRDTIGALSDGIDFWKVRMKPGKPLAYGVLHRGERVVPLFGLPGNPVSCMVNFHQFVAPVLRRMLGQPAPFAAVVSAIAGERFAKKGGRNELRRVVLSYDDAHRLVCHSTGNQSSGVLTSMARAHGLLTLDADAVDLAPGSPCWVQVLDPGFLRQAEPAYHWDQTGGDDGPCC